MTAYCSVRSERVKFIDMEGKVLHELSLPEVGHGKDCLVETYRGDRFLVVSEPFLALLGWNSEVIWKRDGDCHHDVAVEEDGSVFSFAHRPGDLRRGDRTLPFRNQAIVHLGADGRPVGEIDLGRLFSDRIGPDRIARMVQVLDLKGESDRAYLRASDVLHPNSLQIVDRPWEDVQSGDLLVCLRELDLIAVVSRDGTRVPWSWGSGIPDRPHHATLVPNGRILVFDNGTNRGISRVIEVDPQDRSISWEFSGREGSPFFSPVRGGAQKLPGATSSLPRARRGGSSRSNRAERPCGSSSTRTEKANGAGKSTAPTASDPARCPWNCRVPMGVDLPTA